MTGTTGSSSASVLSRAQRRRRLTLALLAAAAAFFALFSSSLWTSDTAGHEIVAFTSLALVVLAIVGRTWCTIYIGGRKKHVLVADGPYSLCRNPLYVFSIVGATGIGLATHSILVGLGLGLASWYVFDRIVRLEEVYLAQHHGAAFAAYCAAVPRWRPNLAGWRDAQSVEVYPERIVITFREAALMLIALPLLELVEWAHDSGLPVLFHLP